MSLTKGCKTIKYNQISSIKYYNKDFRINGTSQSSEGWIIEYVNGKKLRKGLFSTGYIDSHSIKTLNFLIKKLPQNIIKLVSFETAGFIVSDGVIIKKH